MKVRAHSCRHPPKKRANRRRLSFNVSSSLSATSPLTPLLAPTSHTFKSFPHPSLPLSLPHPLPPLNTFLISCFCASLKVGKTMLNFTLRLPFLSGDFCKGIPSPRRILTVPGVTCGSLTWEEGWEGGR